MFICMLIGNSIQEFLRGRSYEGKKHTNLTSYSKDIERKLEHK